MAPAASGSTLPSSRASGTLGSRTVPVGAEQDASALCMRPKTQEPPTASSCLLLTVVPVQAGSAPVDARFRNCIWGSLRSPDRRLEDTSLQNPLCGGNHFLCTYTNILASLRGVNPRRRWNAQVAALKIRQQQSPRGGLDVHSHQTPAPALETQAKETNRRTRDRTEHRRNPTETAPAHRLNPTCVFTSSGRWTPRSHVRSAVTYICVSYPSDINK